MTAYRRWQSTSYRKTRSAANYLCLLIAVKRRRIRYLLLMASFFGQIADLADFGISRCLIANDPSEQPLVCFPRFLFQKFQMRILLQSWKNALYNSYSQIYHLSCRIRFERLMKSAVLLPVLCLYGPIKSYVMDMTIALDPERGC